MISVVIPTLNSEACLAQTLSALVPAAVDGIVREVIIADGGSVDETEFIADAAGAQFLKSEKGRGQQMAEGAAAAKNEWFLFLHADTVLDPGWARETVAFIEKSVRDDKPSRAAAFRFCLDDEGFSPRLLEMLVRLRCAVLCVPYGDQGLLIARHHYEQVGGFQNLPLMEDIDLVRRLGCGGLHLLQNRAVTSAARYRQEGYFLRSARNLLCLALYYLRVPPSYLVRLYG